MKITVLVENTTKSDLIAEHGLSLYIEYKDKKILLDAGQTSVFMDNATTMGIDLSNIDYSVLSHGHYDHSGGYAKLLNEYKDINVYAMENAVLEYYSGNGGTIHDISIPKSVLSEYRNRFKFVNSVCELGDGIYVVPHSTKGLDKIGERTKLYKKCNEDYLADDFSHELSLVFDTNEGLVIFNSCSHGGIVNIVNEVKAALPKRSLYGFVGGLHMKGSKDGQEISTFSEEEIEKIVKYLKAEGLKRLYTGHCTGTPALNLLAKHSGDMIEELFTGKIISL